MAEYNRFISDGLELFGVTDMPKLLAEPKNVLKEVYINTRWDYLFEEKFKRALDLGFIELAEGEAQTYPFDDVEATLGEIRDSGVFTPEEITELEATATQYWNDDKNEI